MLAELVYGAEKSPRRLENLRAVEQFSARLEVLAFPPKAAAHFGQIRADVERLCTAVGPLDMLIGAHARAEGLIIVTNNAREFRRFAGASHRESASAIPAPFHAVKPCGLIYCIYCRSHADEHP